MGQAQRQGTLFFLGGSTSKNFQRVNLGKHQSILKFLIPFSSEGYPTAAKDMGTSSTEALGAFFLTPEQTPPFFRKGPSRALTGIGATFTSKNSPSQWQLGRTLIWARVEKIPQPQNKRATQKALFKAATLSEDLKNLFHPGKRGREEDNFFSPRGFLPMPAI